MRQRICGFAPIRAKLISPPPLSQKIPDGSRQRSIQDRSCPALPEGKDTRAKGVAVSRSVGTGVDGDNVSPGSWRRAASAITRISSIARGAML